MPALYTIGYEGLEIREFLAALHANKVETVVDVRELPLSHKKGFSKNSLQKRLSREHIWYVHVPELGCPRAIRMRYPGRYRVARDWQRFEKDYSRHLRGQGEALTALSVTVGASRCALLCVEADPHFCHRNYGCAGSGATCPRARASPSRREMSELAPPGSTYSSRIPVGSDGHRDWYHSAQNWRLAICCI